MTQIPETHIPQREERRQSSRLRTLLGARIITNNYCSIIDCNIRNKSDGGCQLVVYSQMGVPEVFDMIQNNGVSYRCQVIWRKLDRVGVKFLIN